MEHLGNKEALLMRFLYLIDLDFLVLYVPLWGRLEFAYCTLPRRKEFLPIRKLTFSVNWSHSCTR